MQRWSGLRVPQLVHEEKVSTTPAERVALISRDLVPTIILLSPTNYVASVQDTVEFDADRVHRSVRMVMTLPSPSDIETLFPEISASDLNHEIFDGSHHRMIVPIAIMPPEKIYRASSEFSPGDGVMLGRKHCELVRDQIMTRIRATPTPHPSVPEASFPSRLAEIESSYVKFAEVDCRLGDTIEIVSTWTHEREVTFNAGWSRTGINILDKVVSFVFRSFSKIRYYVGGRPNLFVVHTRMPHFTRSYSLIVNAPDGHFVQNGFATYYPRGRKVQPQEHGFLESQKNVSLRGRGCSVAYLDLNDTNAVARLCKLWIRFYQKSPGGFGAAAIVGWATSITLLAGLIALDRGAFLPPAGTPGGDARFPASAIALIVGLPATVLALTAVRFGVGKPVRYPTGAGLTILLAMTTTLVGGLLLAVGGNFVRLETLKGVYLPLQLLEVSFAAILGALSIDCLRAFFGTSGRYRVRKVIIGVLFLIAMCFFAYTLDAILHEERILWFDYRFVHPGFGYHTLLGASLLMMTARATAMLAYGTTIHWTSREAERAEYH